MSHPGAPTWVIFALLLLIVSFGLPPTCHAEDGDDFMPQGRIGFVSGLRKSLGNVSSQYETGAVIGFEAGYLSYLGETGLGIGPVATTLFKGWYFPSNDQVVDDLLEISELSIGLRARYLIQETSFGFVSFGGTLLRTEIPTDIAKTERLHHGGFLGVGFERFVLRRLYLAVEARFESVIEGSPSGTLLLSISVGG